MRAGQSVFAAVKQHPLSRFRLVLLLLMLRLLL
jgi:hypothetical protein